MSALGRQPPLAPQHPECLLFAPKQPQVTVILLLENFCYRPTADISGTRKTRLKTGLFVLASVMLTADYCSSGSLVSVSQSGRCALLGSPILKSTPSGGGGGGAGQASGSALVCLTTI
jgi:hypothetical protein